MKRQARLTSISYQKGIRRNESIRYRDRKGHLRKFTPKVLLRAEVWKNGKPTGKILNTFDKKTKKIVYRRFSSKERALYHRQILDAFDYEQSGFLRTNIKSLVRVDSQIPKSWVEKVREVIHMDGICLFSVKIYLGDGMVFETQTVAVENTRNLEADIATMIISVLRANRIRTSAKKWSSGKNAYWKTRVKGVGEWAFPRKYEAELIIRGMGF